MVQEFHEKTYPDFLEYLDSLSEPKFREFNLKSINTQRLIGIRIPILKKIAKEIAQMDYENFFYLNTFSSFEETLLYGFVIGYIKVPFDEKLRLLDVLIPHMDNWAVVDCTIANLKDFKKHLEEGYEYILKCLHSSETFQIRLGLVALLDYYVKEEYIDKIFVLSNHISSDEYYVKMANAWLISVCYVKYPKKTLKFYKKNSLNNWTHNKAIQKTMESLRVSKEEKEVLKGLKR